MIQTKMKGSSSKFVHFCVHRCILANIKITGDRPCLQLFPKQVATQLPLLKLINWTRRSFKIKTVKRFKKLTAPNIKKIQPHESTAFGRPVIITGGLNRFYATPTFTSSFAAVHTIKLAVRLAWRSPS